MDITQIGTSLVLVAICYLAGLGAKVSEKIKDNWIPVILGVLGGILGVAGMHVIPEFPANDPMTAFAVGVMSGLTSIGVNQVYKQRKKDA